MMSDQLCAWSDIMEDPYQTNCLCNVMHRLFQAYGTEGGATPHQYNLIHTNIL